MGLERELFNEEDINDDLICFACKKILQDPIACDLGHMLCRLCNDDFKGKCECGLHSFPLRGRQIYKPDENIKMHLENLHVVCKFSKYGCTNHGKCDAKALEHIKNCSFRPESTLLSSNNAK